MTRAKEADFDAVSPAERVRAWRRAAPGFLQRQAKTARQLRHGWAHSRQVGFVFGCQRSGTKMVMRVLDRSPDIRIFHENHASAFQDFQLRSDRTIRALVALNPAPVQVFKPICDSQEADRLLARFPRVRGAWVYRHFDDVANSAVAKWGEHQRDLVEALVKGDAERWGWRTARIPESVRADLRAVYRADLSPAEGAMLFWFARNSFFFELGLDQHPRMTLVRYADLVQQPESAFDALFSHLGADFSPDFIDKVRADSIGRSDPPQASPQIRALCQSLMDRLDAWTPADRPAGDLSSLLMLIDTLGTGGAERYAVTVCNWLDAQGVAVTIASSGGEQVPDLAPGVQHVELPLRQVRGGALPRAARSVRALIDQTQPDAIVSNSLAVTLIARAAQLGRAVPVVNVAHGWPEDRYRQVAPLMRAATRVVAVSPDVKRKLVAAGLPQDRCAVVFNGVDCSNLGRRSDPQRAHARQVMGAGSGEILVAVVGRLEAQKAHQNVIFVAESTRESHPSLRFAIVGDGSREAALAALIAERGVADRVRLVGLRSDVADLLGSADLYLNCSDWEGMPLTTIEAMASGLPVVATRTEGSAQLLNDASGIVVPVGDAEAMAQALGRLAEDADLRQRMGAAARQRALRDFSHDRMVRELVAVIADARRA